MSLKAFHRFFILCAILLSAAVAGWAFRPEESGRVSAYLWLGWLASAGTVALVVYFLWFVKKSRDL